jgi:hypothetical protein
MTAPRTSNHVASEQRARRMRSTTRRMRLATSALGQTGGAIANGSLMRNPLARNAAHPSVVYYHDV